MLEEAGLEPLARNPSRDESTRRDMPASRADVSLRALTTPLLEIVDADAAIRLHLALAELLVSKSAEERGARAVVARGPAQPGVAGDVSRTTLPCGAVKATSRGTSTRRRRECRRHSSARPMCWSRWSCGEQEHGGSARSPRRGFNIEGGDLLARATLTWMETTSVRSRKCWCTLDDPEQEVLIHSARTTRLLYPGLFLEK